MKRKKRKQQRQNLPRAAELVAFTPFEEAFFASGSEPELAELDAPESPSWLRRLLVRLAPQFG